MGYRFKLEKKKSHILKILVSALAGVVDETTFMIDSDEFVVEAIDPGRNCLLKLVMPKEVFSEFECSEGEKYETGICLSDLDKIMKRSTNDDSLELSYDDKDNHLIVTMERSGRKRKRTFRLGEIDVDYEKLPIDNLLEKDYDAGFDIDMSIMDEAVKDAEIYSEVITVTAKKGKSITFSSSGVVGSMDYEIDLEDLESAEVDDNCRASFGLTFLKNVFKVSSIVKSLTIALAKENPMAMIMHIIGGGILYYIIAPRVEYEELDEDE